MSVYDEFIQANHKYLDSFKSGGVPILPKRHVAIVTCMDARIHPEKFLGLEIGDAHIIRNAGGRVSEDVIRSLVISQRLLGTTEVVVIHHTDCGMVTFTNEQLAAKIKSELGVETYQDFLPFTNLEESVKDDVQILRQSPLIPKNFPISGAYYDVKTGRLVEVIRA
jgi:carbonic anhydrase